MSACHHKSGAQLVVLAPVNEAMSVPGNMFVPACDLRMYCTVAAAARGEGCMAGRGEPILELYIVTDECSSANYNSVIGLSLLAMKPSAPAAAATVQYKPHSPSGRLHMPGTAIALLHEPQHHRLRARLVAARGNVGRVVGPSTSAHRTSIFREQMALTELSEQVKTNRKNVIIFTK